MSEPLIKNPAVEWSRTILTAVISPACLIYLAVTMRQMDQQVAINAVLAEAMQRQMDSNRDEQVAQNITVQRSIADLWSAIAVLREEFAAMTPQEFRRRVEELNTRIRALEMAR